MFSIDVRPLVRPCLKVCERQEHMGMLLPPFPTMDSVLPSAHRGRLLQTTLVCNFVGLCSRSLGRRPIVYSGVAFLKSTFATGGGVASTTRSNFCSKALRTMSLDVKSLPQLILLLIWTCLNTHAVVYKHSTFVKVLSSEDLIEQLLSSNSLVFAPGLSDVVRSSTPPAVAWFKSLPTNNKKVWGIYLLVLEKQDSRVKIYIGSGTSVSGGLSNRLGHYDQKRLLPRHVKTALDEGYTITHKGLLCSASIPSVSEVPMTRLFFVALEATFTFVFWALKSKTAYGYGFADMCPWDRDTLEHDGLGSHNPLSEAPAGDLALSAEQLETMAAEYAEKRAKDKRKRRAKQKIEDLDSFNAKNNKYHMDSYYRNPEASREAERRLATKNVELKKYYCEICDHASQTSKDLRNHNLSTRHLHNVATKHLPEDQKYFCEICNRNPGSCKALNRHKTTKMHLENAAAAAAEQQH